MVGQLGSGIIDLRKYVFTQSIAWYAISKKVI